MSNEEKILQILSQIQTDISELKKESQFIKNVTVRMESEHGGKLDALFDGYSANYELIDQIDPRITKLERTVEKLSFEIKYLKSAK